jgi:hypothetical protein
VTISENDLPYTGGDGVARMARQKEADKQGKRKPGVCIPWEEKLKELREISGDKALAQRIWENTDALGYLYIWHCLVSF